MTRQIGRLTLAATLVIMGAVILVDNLTSLHLAWYMGRAWPLILVLLGLEWIWNARDGGPTVTVRLDAGATLLLVIIALVAANVGAGFRAPFPIHSLTPDMPIEVPPAPAAPAFPSPPSFMFRGDARASRTLRYDTPIPDLAEIQVTDSSAAAEVVRGDAFAVELNIDATGGTERQAQEIADQVRLSVTPGKVTKIAAVRPVDVSDLRLTYRVTVPGGVNLRVNTSSGSVSVRGVTGNVTIQTSSGSIDVAGAGGLVVATSSSGSIQITGSQGAIRASATSGSIRVENPAAAVSAQTSSGSITLQTDQVGGDYDLGAMSGSVRVSIPGSAGVKVSARSSSGNVSGPQWLTIGEGRNSGTGTQGTGERQLTLRTSSGSIQIDTH